ncbi:hypothetical protein NEFER03_0856 [Nematocida sp. LUAm3]|nr:hypothetical protein NEFER03_0856 [Nematocida sp. LUAm3]KAI5174874.1 hypothetical protein NEFER02_0974 [Nematocida sp. LUAm2]KAI5177528.1 hypothetical protein NEFER01_0778 [Nematocida sp. LUAm1]
MHTVPPYIYEHRANTKARWVGATLLETLSHEFKRRSSFYFRRAIEEGAIKINGERADPFYVLKNGDVITNIVHRHEPPIPTDEIEVIEELEDILVVDKPSGIPCHPNSAYTKNTLTEILKKRKNLSFISTINRLDKQTSGIVLLGKSAKSSVDWHRALSEKQGEKVYLARVKGIFPEKWITVDLPLSISRETCTTIVHVRDNEYIGKKSTTRFIGIEHVDGHSVVLCVPVTGRTHQIRVHLQAIGYPIQNDQVYRKGYIPENILEKKEILDDFSNISEIEYKKITDFLGIHLTYDYATSLIDTEECRTDEFLDVDEEIESVSCSPMDFVLNSCMHCKNIEKTEILPKFFSLDLHAMQYTIREMTFTADPPKWTNIPKEKILLIISSNIRKYVL